jgi:hypothetical protein
MNTCARCGADLVTYGKRSVCLIGPCAKARKAEDGLRYQIRSAPRMGSTVFVPSAVSLRTRQRRAA